MIYWLIGCGLSLMAGVIMSTKLVEKWGRKPMFVSFDTIPTQVPML
jgi:hypothetical protein